MATIIRMTSENEITEVIINGVVCEDWEVEYLSKEEEKAFIENEYGDEDGWNDDFSFLEDELMEEIYWDSDLDQAE